MVPKLPDAGSNDGEKRDCVKQRGGEMRGIRRQGKERLLHSGRWNVMPRSSRRGWVDVTPAYQSIGMLRVRWMCAGPWDGVVVKVHVSLLRAKVWV